MDKENYKKYSITISIIFLEDFFKSIKENIDKIEKMTMQKLQCHQLANTYDFVIEFKEPQEFIFVRELFTYAHIELLIKEQENKIEEITIERYSIIFGRKSYTNILANLSLQEIDLIERVLKDCKCVYQVFEYDETF